MAVPLRTYPVPLWVITRDRGDKVKITVQVRNVYGSDLVYPVDDTALTFARLLNVKTFNARQLVTIKQLGYAVQVAAGTLPFSLGGTLPRQS